MGENETDRKAQIGKESRSSPGSRHESPPTSSTANEDFEWEICLRVPNNEKSMDAIVLLDSGCTVGNWVSWDFIAAHDIEGEMRPLEHPIIADDINGNPMQALGYISFSWRASPEGRETHGPVLFNVAKIWHLDVDMIFGRAYILKKKLVTINRGKILPLVPHKTAKRAEKVQISELTKKQRQEKEFLDAKRRISKPEGQYCPTQAVDYPASEQGSCPYQPNAQTGYPPTSRGSHPPASKPRDLTAWPPTSGSSSNSHTGYYPQSHGCSSQPHSTGQVYGATQPQSQVHSHTNNPGETYPYNSVDPHQYDSLVPYPQNTGQQYDYGCRKQSR
ncbi:hypothetical protein N7G274_010003 [Stereocaulon virgatum]|uniref:Uncharacterized protein n=1 Tax=Stereocaulon virgatum TaxID=373712 RepID=A0ABR3ZVW8_9LECA